MLHVETTTPMVSPRRRTASVWPGAAAAAAAFTALVLLWPAGGRQGLALVGYILGALVVPVATVAHRFARRAAAGDLCYVPSAAMQWTVRIALSVGVAAGLGHAWLVATEWART